MKIPREFKTPWMLAQETKKETPRCDHFMQTSRSQKKTGWGRCAKLKRPCHETDMEKCGEYTMEATKRFWRGFAKNMSEVMK